MVENNGFRQIVFGKQAQPPGIIGRLGRPACGGDEHRGDRMVPGISIRIGIGVKLLRQFDFQ